MTNKSLRLSVIAIIITAAIISYLHWSHEAIRSLIGIPLAALIAILMIAITPVTAVGNYARSLTLILTMLAIIYPPFLAFMIFSPIAYAVGAIIVNSIDEARTTAIAKVNNKKWYWFSLVLILGLVEIFYLILKKQKLTDSAALYIGIPLLVSLGLTLTPNRSNSLLISTLKTITIALLLAAIVLREGYICLIFSAPIFYLVGAAVAAPIDKLRAYKNKNSKLKASAIATALALLSLEGVSDVTTLPRDNTISISKIVPATIMEIRTQLAKKVVFASSKPYFLRIFPYPAEINGAGLQIGDIRQAKFVAYKQIWWNKVEGDLVLKVVDNSPHKIKFEVVKDDSYLSHYLKWQHSEVLLDPIDTQHTKITWVLSYQRILDPIWYFLPLQQYAVTLAAEELIDNMATPHA
jgi:hypothetical protein